MTGVSPVSYTHLDVYKRQILGCALWSCNLTYNTFTGIRVLIFRAMPSASAGGRLDVSNRIPTYQQIGSELVIRRHFGILFLVYVDVTPLWGRKTENMMSEILSFDISEKPERSIL